MLSTDLLPASRGRSTFLLISYILFNGSYTPPKSYKLKIYHLKAQTVFCNNYNYACFLVELRYIQGVDMQCC